jgi:N-acetylglucosaminyl-diphospho-decaprenol L-rhamnosyltransferase
MSRQSISAIVVSYHTGPRLKECVFALLAAPDVTELILVDNGNPAPMQAWLEDMSQTRAKIQLVSGHGNIGFGAGINLGVAAARGPHLLVINPDAVLRWNSLPGMLSVAESLPAPWIVGGRIYNLVGQEERGPRRRELTLWRAATSMLGWNTWTLENMPAPDAPIEMPVISGAFFLTSKDSMAALNGFDEGYFLHVEDIDLCRRCREVGGTVMYDPRAGALHYGSTSDAPNAVVSGHKADSLERYFRKFASGAIERAIVGLVMPMMRFAMRFTRS